MKRSTERFLTTHTGSLPRPDDLIRMMYAKEEGVPVDRDALARRVRAAVADVVKKQAEAGVDLINDGELSKPSYATYIKDRLNGFGGTGNTFVYQDLADFPEAGAAGVRRSRPLAAQDTGLQRPDQRARPGRRAHRRRQSQGRAGEREGRGRLHERCLPRRGVAVLPQRPLQGFRNLHLRHRRCDARRIRDRGQRRLRRADRLPRSRHGPPHPVRRPRSQGIPQAHPVAYRGAQPCDPEHPAGAAPPASVLGQLRGAASLRRAASRHHRRRFCGAAGRDFARSRQSAPRPRVRAVRDRQAACRARC